VLIFFEVELISVKFCRLLLPLASRLPFFFSTQICFGVVPPLGPLLGDSVSVLFLNLFPFFSRPRFPAFFLALCNTDQIVFISPFSPSFAPLLTGDFGG